MANNKRLLEANKAYNLVVPENNDAVKRLAFLGEEYSRDGKKNYWMYEHIKNDKVNRIVVYSLVDGDFICDGDTISPFEGRRWGLACHVVEINNQSRVKCSKLIEKLKKLEVFQE